MQMAPIVRELIAAGVVGDALVAAIERIEAANNSTGIPPESAIEKRRAYDRERKRRKATNSANSTGIPPVSTGIPPDAEKRTTSLSSLPSSPQDLNSKEEGSKKEIARGKTIPPEWQPNVGHLAAGKQLGLTDPQIREMAEDLRLWAQSNSNRSVARKANWDLTFLAWMRRNKPKAVGPPTNGHSAIPRPGSREDRQEKNADAIRKLSEFIADRADDRRASGAAGETPSGQLLVPKSA